MLNFGPPQWPTHAHTRTHANERSNTTCVHANYTIPLLLHFENSLRDCAEPLVHPLAPIHVTKAQSAVHANGHACAHLRAVA